MSTIYVHSATVRMHALGAAPPVGRPRDLQGSHRTCRPPPPTVHPLPKAAHNVPYRGTSSPRMAGARRFHASTRRRAGPFLVLYARAEQAGQEKLVVPCCFPSLFGQR